MKYAVIFFIVLLFAGTALYTFTPQGRRAFNKYGATLQHADNETRYATTKQVEDTCRAMIASYNADVYSYRAYKSEDQHDLATMAKIRANRTAATYNEYILKNRFVFRNNVPPDIDVELMMEQ